MVFAVILAPDSQRIQFDVEAHERKFEESNLVEITWVSNKSQALDDDNARLMDTEEMNFPDQGGRKSPTTVVESKRSRPGRSLGLFSSHRPYLGMWSEVSNSISSGGTGKFSDGRMGDWSGRLVHPLSLREAQELAQGESSLVGIEPGFSQNSSPQRELTCHLSYPIGFALFVYELKLTYLDRLEFKGGRIERTSATMTTWTEEAVKKRIKSEILSGNFGR
nr:uncharacterized protein LOC109136429 [Ipomoea batatas]